MAGYYAKYRFGSDETGYLRLAGTNELLIKIRVLTSDQATIFVNGIDAIITGSTELQPGETVEPIHWL